MAFMVRNKLVISALRGVQLNHTETHEVSLRWLIRMGVGSCEEAAVCRLAWQWQGDKLG